MQVESANLDTDRMDSDSGQMATRSIPFGKRLTLVADAAESTAPVVSHACVLLLQIDILAGPQAPGSFFNSSKWAEQCRAAGSGRRTWRPTVISIIITYPGARDQGESKKNTRPTGGRQSR